MNKKLKATLTVAAVSGLAVFGVAATAHALDYTPWGEHVHSYIMNGQAVHPAHEHAPAVREVQPDPVEGERLITVDRVSGANRYETAVLVNQLVETGAGVKFAFIVSGDNPVDALPTAATGLGQVFYIPGNGALSQSVTNELYHLQPDVIVVVGGPSTVSDAALQSIRVIRP